MLFYRYIECICNHQMAHKLFIIWRNDVEYNLVLTHKFRSLELYISYN